MPYADPETQKQAVAAYRRWLKTLGFRPANIVIHDDDRKALLEYAAKLRKARRKKLGIAENINKMTRQQREELGITGRVLDSI